MEVTAYCGDRPLWIVDVVRIDGAHRIQARARLDGEDVGVYPEDRAPASSRPCERQCADRR